MSLRLALPVALPVALLVVAAVPAATAANPQQSGTATNCLSDYQAWFFTAPLTPEPLRNKVVVQPGTVFFVRTSAGYAFVDFFAANGAWLGWNNGGSPGWVPVGAAFGEICTAVGVPPPAWEHIPEYMPDYVPNPAATWTYQDGFRA